MKESYEDNLRALVALALSHRISKTAIAKRARYERSAFNQWVLKRDRGMTIGNAERIRKACVELISEKRST